MIWYERATIKRNETFFVILLGDFRKWIKERKLKLNDDKTEVMIVRGNLRRNLANDFGVLNLGNVELAPVEIAKNLGVMFDSSLSFTNHINSVVKTCNYHICSLYIICWFLQKENVLALVHSLIVTRVDYCNSLFLGFPNVVLRKLQSVLNRAARLIFLLPPRQPTTPFLIDLHWPGLGLSLRSACLHSKPLSLVSHSTLLIY